MAIAANGDVLVAGFTNRPGAAQPALGGGNDGFVSRMTGDLLGQLPQAITFPAQPAQAYSVGGTFTISPAATAESGLPVTYSIDSSSDSVCAIVGNTVAIKTAGICRVLAKQGGDEFGWEETAEVTQDIVIAKAVQAIDFPAQAEQTYVAGGTFEINPAATSTSGLGLAYSSDMPSVCTVSGTIVSMLGAGTCTVRAGQLGNVNWLAAADAVQNITLHAAAPITGTTATPVPALGTWALALISLIARAVGSSRLRRRAG